jgi:hypothetical protein
MYPSFGDGWPGAKNYEAGSNRIADKSDSYQGMTSVMPKVLTLRSASPAGGLNFSSITIEELPRCVSSSRQAFIETASPQTPPNSAATPSRCASLEFRFR